MRNINLRKSRQLLEQIFKTKFLSKKHIGIFTTTIV